MKHPALRVAAWEWIAPEYRARITDCILHCAVPTLPFRPVRVEVVGSLARGCGHAGSDLDLNLAAHDWNEQVEWRRMWAEPRHRGRFMQALAPVTSALRFNIEAAPDNPDQHQYDITFDLLTGARSDPDARFPDRSGRWWDIEAFRWRPKLDPRLAELPEHEAWPTEVLVHWERIYAERFCHHVHLRCGLGRDPAFAHADDAGAST